MLNFLKIIYYFCKQIHVLMMKHNGFLFAKSLAFQTLFCFVPAIVTILFIAGYVNLLDQPILEIKNILSEQFIPQAIQQSLIPQLQHAVDNARSASIFAVSIFLFSTFSLITSIQTIYYQFSEQNCHPPIKNQIIVYLLFILSTIALIFLTGGLAYFLSHTNTTYFYLSEIAIRILNFLVLSLMIFAFYSLISPINFKKGITFLISLIVGIILFFAQKLFILYVLWFPGYMLVYGAVAFLPLLFFWLYIYWVIFLYGYSVLLKTHSEKI